MGKDDQIQVLNKEKEQPEERKRNQQK
ncbi:hypothetical protein CCACVL1_27763, partial [Corchorus capsularis]